MPKRDYYGDGEETPPPKSPKPETQDSEEDGSATALIPKSLLGNQPFNVGDTVELEIVALHENEAEVRYYSPHSEEDEEAEEESETEAPMPEQSRMSAYMD